MIRRPTRSTRTDTHFPDTTFFRSQPPAISEHDVVVVPKVVADTLIEPPEEHREGAYPHDPAQPPGRTGTHKRGDQQQYRSPRSEAHTSDLQSLMRISYAVYCLKKKNKHTTKTTNTHRKTHNA